MGWGVEAWLLLYRESFVKAHAGEEGTERPCGRDRTPCVNLAFCLHPVRIGRVNLAFCLHPVRIGRCAALHAPHSHLNCLLTAAPIVSPSLLPPQVAGVKDGVIPAFLATVAGSLQPSDSPPELSAIEAGARAVAGSNYLLGALPAPQPAAGGGDSGTRTAAAVGSSEGAPGAGSGDSGAPVAAAVGSGDSSAPTPAAAAAAAEGISVRFALSYDAPQRRQGSALDPKDVKRGPAIGYIMCAVLGWGAVGLVKCRLEERGASALHLAMRHQPLLALNRLKHAVCLYSCAAAVVWTRRQACSRR